MESRQMKRHAKVRIKGREVEVIRYLEQMAKRIPLIIDKEGKPIDHVKNLRSVYMIDGYDGVKKYLNLCSGVFRRSRANWTTRWFYEIKLRIWRSK